jgi:hypothetical protein
MTTTKLTAIVLCAALIAGCASNREMRGLTSEVRGHVQSNNLPGLAEVLDAQSPETREQLFYEAPGARDAYAKWKGMSEDEQEAARNSFALVDESAPAPLPEAFFSESISEVQAKIIDLCARSDAPPVEITSNMVVCYGRAGFGTALAHALFTPAYSSAPMQRVSFAIYPVGERTKVSVSGWTESQSAFGQANRFEMASANEKRAFRRLLVSIGGE